MSKVKSKLECPKCNNLFSARGGNYKKHIDSCDGSYKPFVKLVSCKYCNVAFDENMSAALRANHSRWCDNNTKRDYYTKVTNNGSQLRTTNAIEKRIESIKKAHADGKYISSHREKKGKPGTPHTEETKKLLREKALASPHRRLRRKMIEYKGLMLDSTWEYELAKRLDNLGVIWVRPDPLPWTDDEGIKHNYFPDFYLPDYDLFLDPKNPYARKVQKKKLRCLLTQYSNIIILNTLKECKEWTHQL